MKLSEIQLFRILVLKSAFVMIIALVMVWSMALPAFAVISEGLFVVQAVKYKLEKCSLFFLK